MKKVIKLVKENTTLRDFIETVLLMSTVSALFYISVWIFH